MISVVIPTLNAEQSLTATLAALMAAAMGGLVRQVIIADGGSTDETLAIADDAGATIVRTRKGRGHQLAEGANAARGPFLLFLHADTVLETGWADEALQFIRTPGERRAAAFHFALDAGERLARIVEHMVALRCRMFALPYGDQGLLMAKSFYDELGGFADLPLMEDVDLVRRIGRKRLTLLSSRARTSAARYHKGGYFRRPLRNLSILALYGLGVHPTRLARLYG